MKKKCDCENNCENKTDMDNAKNLAMLLGEFKVIAGDLRFLHGVLYDENGDEDERRKVQIATPYLETKFSFINDLLKDYSKYLPDELREKLKLESEVV